MVLLTVAAFMLVAVSGTVFGLDYLIDTVEVEDGTATYEFEAGEYRIVAGDEEINLEVTEDGDVYVNGEYADDGVVDMRTEEDVANDYEVVDKNFDEALEYRFFDGTLENPDVTDFSDYEIEVCDMDGEVLVSESLEADGSFDVEFEEHELTEMHGEDYTFEILNAVGEVVADGIVE